jgi:hypothetical protein
MQTHFSISLPETLVSSPFTSPDQRAHSGASLPSSLPSKVIKVAQFLVYWPIDQFWPPLCSSLHFTGADSAHCSSQAPSQVALGSN